MFLISQDGRKAIDEKEVNYFFVAKNGDNWNLIVMPKGQTGNWEWSSLILFRHQSEEVVKQMLWFLLWCLQTAPTDLLKVDIQTFYAHGMERFTPELLGRK